MKLRFPSSVLVFVSAYSPLSIIFAIQDFDFEKKWFSHPLSVFWILGISAISCIVVLAAVGLAKSSSSPIKILRVSNRSGELINYSIPYMISFFVMDMGSAKQMISFGFFMLLMYWITLKTHNIFVNPVLACFGYNLYDVRYTKDEQEREDFFLIKGERLKPGEICRVRELSEKLFLVTDRNPTV